jgi:hypothetical protein
MNVLSSQTHYPEARFLSCGRVADLAPSAGPRVG